MSADHSNSQSNLTKNGKASETLPCKRPAPQKLPIKPTLEELYAHRENLYERLTHLQSEYGRKLHPIAEPQRSTSMWDHLLGEMEWMSQDFDKERKLKLNNAKRLVRAVQSSLNQIKDQEFREEEEIKAQRKKAAFAVGRIAKHYWKIIEKLASHIRSENLEQQRKAIRSKKLEQLVEQQLELSNEVAKKLSRQVGAVKVTLKKEKGKWKPTENEPEENLEELFQPKGNTLETAKVYTKPAFLLRGNMREYQHIGVDWLVTLHDKRVNGILADEMGLGKTIQTIAMLAYLACERGIWGPHLIVVPTSIILNWEMELKKWCPGLKVLTYFGNQKQRKEKRIGWSKLSSFNVCITSYKLVVQDQFAFKRKQWYYLILDEAQYIKNFHSQRWNVLLNFRSKRRLLLTGTPMQNDVIEIWSLLHFLMPHMFTSHEDFKAWFSSPFNQAIAQNKDFSQPIIKRLQSILRPFLLRRMKKDVEKQLPEKFEHIVFCPLSRRQQFLYDEFLESRLSGTTDCIGMMNVLMQLRKVCNHPDLFAPRSISSPFFIEKLNISVHKTMLFELKRVPGTKFWQRECFSKTQLKGLIEAKVRKIAVTDIPDILEYSESQEKTLPHVDINPVYGKGLHQILYFHPPCPYKVLPAERLSQMDELLSRFQVIQPKVVADTPQLNLNSNCALSQRLKSQEAYLYKKLLPYLAILHSIMARTRLLIPEKRALENDCGKFRKLSVLLGDLHKGDHKVIVFTQMARMLDVLEKFLNLHGYSYVRLDGNTKVEDRQYAVDKFNLDPKVFCFISSTRSGGLGLNLTGADTVVFYDTDWNPAMDKQAQDRTHRIGQFRNVHIYRLISSYTIEENILKKSLQKRHLDNLIMEGGEFTTEFFQSKKVHIKEFFEELGEKELEAACKAVEDTEDVQALQAAREEELKDKEEFDEKQNLFEDLDPVSRRCVEFYLEENPVETLQEESLQQVNREEEDSEEEDMKVQWEPDGRSIFEEKMDFLQKNYFVY